MHVLYVKKKSKVIKTIDFPIFASTIHPALSWLAETKSNGNLVMPRAFYNNTFTQFQQHNLYNNHKNDDISLLESVAFVMESLHLNL